LKDRLAGMGVSAVSAATTVLAGAPWWAVLAVVLAVLGMTCGMVLWLANPKRSRHVSVSCFRITWEAPREPEKPPPKDVGLVALVPGSEQRYEPDLDVAEVHGDRVYLRPGAGRDGPTDR
jgi:hypothetical protein